MKTPSNTDPVRAPARWDTLVQQAADDSPPPVDTAALLRAVRRASAQAMPPAAGTPADWLAELSDWLSARRVIPACFAAACVLAAAITWQIAEVWTALDWAQWGGAL
ncbi:hypothetical protein OH491_07465 [Termitidicoccus mucosus]|uniref:Uncharacterized protein n=1 Tax=Termitidicoccus mucosus TaxID=1184151 RepID=A0A178IFP9_9BACT|nr:hypothetical protein AW736_21610 [Opitutaceae bacterium TSB47]